MYESLNKDKMKRIRKCDEDRNTIVTTSFVYTLYFVSNFWHSEATTGPPGHPTHAIALESQTLFDSVTQTTRFPERITMINYVNLKFLGFSFVALE